MSTPWDAFCRSSASKISFYIPAYSSGGGGEQWPQLQRDSSAGANVKAVQKMLGHASAAMTLDIYADLFDDDLEAVAAALDQARSREVVGKMWARGWAEGGKRLGRWAAKRGEPNREYRR
jgi:hypothetical protein